MKPASSAAATITPPLGLRQRAPYVLAVDLVDLVPALLTTQAKHEAPRLPLLHAPGLHHVAGERCGDVAELATRQPRAGCNAIEVISERIPELVPPADEARLPWRARAARQVAAEV